MQAIDGLRVLEIGGGLAASYATRLLADLGADVCKVEPPGGDPQRRVEGRFQYLNGAKRSAVVDLGTAQGRGWLVAAVADADVVIEHLGAGELERLGVGPDVLVGAQPALALVRISDFGQAGPSVQMRRALPQWSACGASR